ncbi:hypothetical protein JOB18_039110 [Solea senegalensis]|uniref:Uncharacterized protein n=1 Tax=Solea senegalensis TaxID=28829 RepID=A0AAV6RTL5_SOLSE|nr:hypothetical protein JOB18_039110 [Solea senegalensis]
MQWLNEYVEQVQRHTVTHFTLAADFTGQSSSCLSTVLCERLGKHRQDTSTLCFLRSQDAEDGASLTEQVTPPSRHHGSGSGSAHIC